MNPSHSKVSCKYGAPMGRGGDAPLNAAQRIHLQRVKLDSGGYDRGGAYWGVGEPLFVAWDDTEGEVYLRASGRDRAKLILNARHERQLKYYR